MFTSEYKLAMVAAYDAASEPGARGALLRRDNERLAAELARMKAALEIVGKAHALLGLLSESAETTREPRRRK